MRTYETVPKFTENKLTETSSIDQECSKVADEDNKLFKSNAKTPIKASSMDVLVSMIVRNSAVSFVSLTILPHLRSKYSSQRTQD